MDRYTHLRAPFACDIVKPYVKDCVCALTEMIARGASDAELRRCAAQKLSGTGLGGAL